MGSEWEMNEGSDTLTDRQIAQKAFKITGIFYTVTLLILGIYEVIVNSSIGINLLLFLLGQVIYWSIFIYNKMQ